MRRNTNWEETKSDMEGFTTIDHDSGNILYGDDGAVLFGKTGMPVVASEIEVPDALFAYRWRPEDTYIDEARSSVEHALSYDIAGDTYLIRRIFEFGGLHATQVQLWPGGDTPTEYEWMKVTNPATGDYVYHYAPDPNPVDIISFLVYYRPSASRIEDRYHIEPELTGEIGEEIWGHA